MNLLQETLEKLKDNHKTIDDVVFICGEDFEITKEDFLKYADVEYDSGYGGQEIAQDLKIVGNNWWLERAEYDGAEWWEFKTIPERPAAVEKIKKLNVTAEMCGWKNLKELQEE